MPRIAKRLLVIVPVGVGLAVLVAAADPISQTTAARDLFEGQPELAAERNELNDRFDYVASRMSLKEQLVGSLIAGDLTLDEVTDEFLRLNESEPKVVAVIRSRYPGSGIEEKTARNVLEYVRGRVPAGEDGSLLMARLDRQFQARFGHSANLD